MAIILTKRIKKIDSNAHHMLLFTLKVLKNNAKHLLSLSILLILNVPMTLQRWDVNNHWFKKNCVYFLNKTICEYTVLYFNSLKTFVK